MLPLKRILFFWFLCSQVLFASIAGAGATAHDDLHVATVHQLAVDHHHHDDFSSHFDHDDGSGAHVHVVDSFQSFGLAHEQPSAWNLVGSQKQPGLSIAKPPVVFLEGLLRPPQMLL